MTDEQRQEKRQSRERRDAGNTEGDEEMQETELKQQKRSADKDVKNQDSKKQVQGEMDVDAVQSGETSDTFWEDEVDVDTEWIMMQEIEGAVGEGGLEDHVRHPGDLQLQSKMLRRMRVRSMTARAR